MRSITARAGINIALIKYWGKRSEDLNLPLAGSIGITLRELFATCNVRMSRSFSEDFGVLNGFPFTSRSPEYRSHIAPVIAAGRALGGTKLKLKLDCTTNFPISAGLASSAAGCGALAAAVNAIFRLSLSSRELSILARQGSGSAARSVCGGFVEWHAGASGSGEDSFAESVSSPDEWPDLRVVICITDRSPKCISSRTAMSSSKRTSPFFDSFINQTRNALPCMRGAIARRSFAEIGRLMEESCLAMHATMLTSKPPAFFWSGKTIELIKQVVSLREDGLEAYFTIDAGSQVKIFCHVRDVDSIVHRLRGSGATDEIICSAPGAGAHVE